MSTVGRGARVLAAVVLVGACKAGKDDADAAKIKQSIKPHFAPVSTTTTTTAPIGAGTVAPTASSTVPGSSTSTSGPVAAATTSASFTDAAGDVTAPPVDRPPAWADLLGASLVRRADGFELRVHLGDAAPTTTDENHTMNVASFFDVDGDGTIDYEVWANVAARGWGASYFDDVHHGGGYQEKSGVTVTPDGDEVVLRFPLSHLAEADHFRWSIASEWGTYQTLGTIASARDDAPDDGRATGFPGT